MDEVCVCGGGGGGGGEAKATRNGCFRNSFCSRTASPVASVFDVPCFDVCGRCLVSP